MHLELIVAYQLMALHRIFYLSTIPYVDEVPIVSIKYAWNTRYSLHLVPNLCCNLNKGDQ